ncbi:uncharacterized protein LOC125075181 [Vanessa atalanta]|uniref:uncharacterized protein LOC125075181 n=1 Tax=Vanessa atalanta TaxID=42275 RepID=UPI001FCE1B74|nr:uncharacterized protein LOC125075181 [Vanessa atalanta]
MECPCRWAVLYTIIFFITQTTNVFCQFVKIEERPAYYETKDVTKRDVSKYFNPSSKTIAETFLTNIQDDRPKTLNVISQVPSCYSQEPTLFGQSALSGNNPNVVFAPSCATLPELISCNGIIPLENYANANQQSSVYQISQPTNDLNYCPVTLKINPSSIMLPTTNTQSGIGEFLNEISRGGVFQEPFVIKNGYEDGIPVNLQINIPSQNTPAPRITVVSATPTPVTSANSESVIPFPQFGYPPPPAPIVRKKSRCWKNLLPILLLALLSDQGCGNGCCCPCNCCCNSDSPIPIPYPIPIPVNSPIINNQKSSCSSRKRGHRDNEDDDDECN